MTKQEILDKIETEITTNGLQKINGAILNTVLTAIAEIIPDDSLITSSFGGTVDPASSIIVTPGIPKWFFAKTGTYPNAGGMIITQGKLGILSYNGTIWSKLELDIPGMKKALELDPLNDEDAITGKQINYWLVNKVPGGESDEISETVEEVGEFYKKIGIDLVGGNTSSIQAGAFNVVTNSTALADADKFLTKGFINLSTAGNFKFCIGRWDAANNKFVVRWQSDEKSGVIGWNGFSFQEKINAGEIPAIFCLPTSTASMRWGDPGAPGNRFQQYSTVSGMAQANFGSYFSIYFELSNINTVKLPTDGRYNLSKSVSKIVGNFAANGYAGLESTIGESVVSTDSDSNEGYAINKIELETSYLLEKLEIRTVSAGSYKIAVGFFDQYKKFIEKKVITKTLIAGLNTVFIDPIILEIGDYIGLKTPGKLPVNNNPTEANLWTSDGYLSSLVQVPGKSLPIKLFLKEYISSPIVTKSELSDTNGKVDGLQQKFILNGKSVNLKFNPNGTTTWEYNEGYDKILVIGNSLAIHAITPIWWGLYGMAASKRENDYAHRILAKMQVYKPNATMKVISLSAWENNPAGYDKSLLDADLVGQKFIPIRLGENASYNNEFQTRFAELIDYIISKAPTAKIVIGGVFWTEPAKDAAMKAVADSRNIPFVKMDDLNIPENRSAIGNQVLGDDGQLHSINDNGVAGHPGDLGHERIAVRNMGAIGL